MAFGYANGNPLLYTDPLGLWSWKSFGKGAATAVAAAAVGTVVVIVVAGTGGAAAVVIAGALGASSATVATAGAAVSGTVYVAAAGYGGFQTGQKAYEGMTGREYSLDGRGRALSEEEQSASAGEAATGVAMVAAMGGKARSARAQAPQDQAMIDALVAERAARMAKGTETGDATLAQGRTVAGKATPVVESDPSGSPHAEPQAMPLGGTTTVDQNPCPACAKAAYTRGARIVVPENPAKPEMSPKSAAQKAAAGKVSVRPRVAVEGPQGPIPVVPPGGNRSEKPSRSSGVESKGRVSGENDAEEE
jgi:hypothetical protein